MKDMIDNITIKTVLVEDKENDRNVLLDILQDFIKDVEIVGVASSAETALKLIELKKPDLILIDIMLAGKPSFNIFEKANYKAFDTIFITDNQEFAIKAFELSVVDYIIKPVTLQRLSQGIQKIREKRKIQETTNLSSCQIDTFRQSDKDRKIILPTLEMVHIVELAHILYCQATQNYTTFHLSEGLTIVVSKTLKVYEEMLSTYNFIRVHKSWLINLQHTKGYDKRDGGFAIMSNDFKIPISSFKKEEFLYMLKKDRLY